MALRLSICHQSSENEGAASSGAHVISTICDSTHEALVRVNFLFLGRGWKKEGGRGTRASGIMYVRVSGMCVGGRGGVVVHGCMFGNKRSVMYTYK